MTSKLTARRALRFLAKSTLLVALAMGLSLCMEAPLAFSASFLNGSKPSDFDFADFYNVVADQRPVSQLDNQIVIINLDHSDRAEIADVLELLQLVEPRAVGIDVVFNNPKDSLTDARLIAMMRATPRLVLAQALDFDYASKRFTAGERSFLADSVPLAIAGATNLPSRHAKGTVRSFLHSFPMADSTVIAGFAAAVAELAAPQAAAQMKARREAAHTINYPSRVFTTISPAGLVDSLDAVDGRIVLLGAVNAYEDMHPTPVRADMSGIMIHAHSLSTIVNARWLTRLPAWADWLIALAICYLIVALSLKVPILIKGLTLRITQALLMIGVCILGYTLFVDHSLIMNLGLSMLMVTFGLFAFDIWLGLTTIATWSLRRHRAALTPVNPDQSTTI